MAAADPREMPVKVRTYSKVADLMQHNWTRWGGALYAAAFLQRVRRRAPVGPPRHRGAGVQQPRRRPATSPRAAPGSRCRRWWSWPPTLPRASGGRPLLPAAVVLPHPRRDSRPRRRRTTARCAGWRTRCAHSTDGTRRRVHSPSWATSSSVTSLTAVRGSTKPSTPRRVVDELAQVLLVGGVGGAHRRGACRRAGRADACRCRRAAEPVDPTHGPSVPAGTEVSLNSATPARGARRVDQTSRQVQRWLVDTGASATRAQEDGGAVTDELRRGRSRGGQRRLRVRAAGGPARPVGRRWSRRASSAAPACTSAASRPRPCSTRPRSPTRPATPSSSGSTPPSRASTWAASTSTRTASSPGSSRA